MNQLYEEVYRELRSLAATYLAREGGHETTRPTSLVHEAYVRLLAREELAITDRTHFFAIGATVIRGVLVDRARGRGAAKRGGGWQRITLDDGCMISAESDVELIDLDDALTKLARLNPRQAQVVEMHVFGGLAPADVAPQIGTARRTVEKDLQMARAWLDREMHGDNTRRA